MALTRIMATNVWVEFDFDIGGMTMGQGHDINHQIPVWSSI